MLQHERDQRQRLEEMVEQLARQHSSLEKAAKDHNLPRQSKDGNNLIFNIYILIGFWENIDLIELYILFFFLF